VAGVVLGTDPVQDIIAFGVLVIAFLGYRNGRIAKRNTVKLDNNTDKLDEVHTLVNNQLSQSEDRRTAADKRERATNVENEQLRAAATEPYDQGDK
jgi:hypothetical protein